MIFKRNSVIFSWLVSYMVILLVPVLTGVFIYSRTNQTIVEEINRSNNLILSKVQKDMSTLLEDANRLSVEIAINPRVQELLAIREPLKPEQYFTVYKAFESLKVFNTSNRWNDYFVYIKAIDTIITPNLSNTSDSVFHSLYGASGVGYEAWIEYLGGSYKGDYVRLGNNLAFIRSIPIGKNGASQGNIVIFLDRAKFWVDNAEEYLYNGAAAVIDSNNQVLASSRSMDGPLPVSYEDLASSGVVKLQDSGQEMVVSYISLGATDWKYVIMMPSHIFWDKLEGVKKATILSLIICLLVGGILTYTFVRRNYSPVRGILDMFKEKKSGDRAGSKKFNEYDLMQRAIHSTLLENKEMGSKLWRQKSVMRDHFLEKLLKGRESAIPLQQLMDLHETAFISDQFAVLIINVEDYNDISPSLVRFAVMNVTEEMARRVHQGYVLEMDDFIVCLVNFRQETELEWRRELSEVADNVLQFMESNYRVTVTVAISRRHPSAAEISKAYYEALEVMEYQSIYGVSGVMEFSDMEMPRTKGEYYYPLEKEQALMNCIKAGDYDSAEAIIDEVFKDNLEQRKLPLKLAKCLFVDLVGTMIKTINGISGMYDNTYLEELNPIDRLLGCQTVSEMKDQLKSILRSICDSVEQKLVGKRANDLLQTIKEIVEAQYNDLNLSIASIAEQVGLHPAYVSKLYKDGTGASLLDDIGKYRIEQAKQIMKDQKMNMEAVALMVGYANVRTFRRVFAKYEGVTPGKYSELIE
ncbi:helix-turn-helix domain-containing protein [Paenibacillus sp. GCM10027626]|uniref:helix-turn-helix domain-containing protein n=1 Tax=Paenibacillus sp. GCM10027626 TaxID=3273411 RepID=UPI003632658B